MKSTAAFCVTPVSRFTAAPQSHGGNTTRYAAALFFFRLERAVDCRWECEWLCSGGSYLCREDASLVAAEDSPESPHGAAVWLRSQDLALNATGLEEPQERCL
ncbi:U6 snRNA-associated Sm-like protein LSm4 isoform X3 [Rattus norvegicus]|uniref:U6 snRNA-associated Sm-like protein LSm4 isoform X3 n=1 Tax=Rattus norvegicus TaxID=10116 RepID=UPI001916CEC3|nr:U6 snRNA-associated Sm-like protein LSm4 isoform X2 [Rattus norvegicus]